MLHEDILGRFFILVYLNTDLLPSTVGGITRSLFGHACRYPDIHCGQTRRELLSVATKIDVKKRILFILVYIFIYFSKKTVNSAAAR